jgi:hypothetical protein
VLRTHDPDAVINIDRVRELIDVTSVVPVADLCDAIQDAGFIAKPLNATPGAWSFGSTVRLLLRAVLFGCLGALGSAVVGIGIGILNLETNPECSAATDEGACAMGIVGFAFGFAFLGGGICGAITLIRGGMRLVRAWQVSRQATL